MNKKIIKYILIAIPLLFLAKWGIETVIYDSNKIPDVNPHPTQKVRIYGKFPFKDDVNLNIRINYLTTNPKCEYVTSWIAGTTPRPRHKEIFFSTTITKNSNYEAIAYLDSFLEGPCRWHASSISASLLSNGKRLAIEGETISHNKRQPSDIYIADIDQKNMDENSSVHTIRCTKETHQRKWAKLICINKVDEQKIINSLQKEIEINFIDMGLNVSREDLLKD
ncbi:MAG: hypothetical protein PHI79_06490 [Sulfurovaceae bacterium]|nr:hypothetical protein [Sulfurovaceae bacterium]MDD5549224.1 hypothetical protein [Sulfurovaceae bacterium]